MDEEEKKEKREKLREFKGDVYRKNMSLAFSQSPGGGASDPGGAYSKGINSSDTWQGPFADEQAAKAKREVDELANLFIGLSADVQAEISALG